MPKMRPRPDPEAEYVDQILAARAEFEAGFKRSKRRNLWRQWQGLNVTIYRRLDDYYGWAVVGPEGKEFSSYGYESEEDALIALCDKLGIGL